MHLFLVRHAHALDGASDGLRPLSPKGRRQVKQLADFLHRAGVFDPVEIWHSSLVRAGQTAELLVRRLKVRPPLRSVEELAPGTNPRRLMRALARTKVSVALVGHEPHLSAFASLLITGRMGPPVFVLKKCSVLALEQQGRRWAVRWQLSPDLFG